MRNQKYRCYYPHRLRYLVSPVWGMFLISQIQWDKKHQSQLSNISNQSLGTLTIQMTQIKVPDNLKTKWSQKRRHKQSGDWNWAHHVTSHISLCTQCVSQFLCYGQSFFLHWLGWGIRYLPSLLIQFLCTLEASYSGMASVLGADGFIREAIRHGGVWKFQTVCKIYSLRQQS